MTTEPVRRKAYSYIRFSTPEQAKGDSHRRQTEKARAYAEAHGLELDTTLTVEGLPVLLEDRGVSAFHNAHAKTGALSVFLQAVKEGVVAPGSSLLIENIDRLTRDDILEASELFLGILRSGIEVVTLTNGFRYSRESVKAEPNVMFQIVMELIRANQENVRKAQLLSDAYFRKRRDAAEGTEKGKPFTRMLPAWLLFNEETRKVEADPKRAKVLLSIFEKAGGGWGQHRIAQWLNERGVPTWGGRGNQRRAEHWHRSYVKKLLTNSAVVGTFTPHQKRTDANGKRERKPLDPIENYFPAVVERELFERVASRVRAPAARGRNATTEPASIFAGVLRCALCGGVVTRVSKGTYAYLVCSRANQKGTKGCKYQAVRYEDVEQALRTNARAIIKDAPRGLGTEELDAEITRLDTVVSVIADEVRDVADELIHSKSNVLRQRLREKDAEWMEARENLRDLRARRDAMSKPYVLKRLKALREALRRRAPKGHKPATVAEINNVLKEAVSKIVLDPEAGRLIIHWQHAPDTPMDGAQAVPFWSRHFTGFDDAEGPKA